MDFIMRWPVNASVSYCYGQCLLWQLNAMAHYRLLEKAIFWEEGGDIICLELFPNILKLCPVSATASLCQPVTAAGPRLHSNERRSSFNQHLAPCFTNSVCHFQSPGQLARIYNPLLSHHQYLVATLLVATGQGWQQQTTAGH